MNFDKKYLSSADEKRDDMTAAQESFAKKVAAIGLWRRNMAPQQDNSDDGAACDPYLPISQCPARHR